MTCGVSPGGSSMLMNCAPLTACNWRRPWSGVASARRKELSSVPVSVSQKARRRSVFRLSSSLDCCRNREIISRTYPVSRLAAFHLASDIPLATFQPRIEPGGGPAPVRDEPPRARLPTSDRSFSSWCRNPSPRARLRGRRFRRRRRAVPDILRPELS